MQIHPEANHTAQLGHLTLWSAVLRDVTDTINRGVRSGVITRELEPVCANFDAAKAALRSDAVEALEFLQSAGAVKLCDMFHVDPSWVLRRIRVMAEGKARAATSRPENGFRPTDMDGFKFKTWTVVQSVGESSSEGFLWRCRCGDCGTVRVFPGSRIRRGLAGTCGCQSKEAKKRAEGRDRKAQAPDQCIHCGKQLGKRVNGPPKLFCDRKCKSAHAYRKLKQEAVA